MGHSLGVTLMCLVPLRDLWANIRSCPNHLYIAGRGALGTAQSTSRQLLGTQDYRHVYINERERGIPTKHLLVEIGRDNITF